MKINNNNAFSLIELSIVIIIIGLLVAGVTGGKSLIDSARLQAGIREINSLKTSIYGFYGRYERLPGDVKNIGSIGRNLNKISDSYYTSQGFEGDYANKDISSMASPWVELYTSGFYDFKPTTDDQKLANSHILYAGETHPYFKYIDDGELASTATGWGTSFVTIESESNVSSSLYKAKGTYAAVGSMKGYELDPKILEKYDKKMDDGIAGIGNVRSMCISQASYGSASYQESADEKQKCQAILFKVMDR